MANAKLNQNVFPFECFSIVVCFLNVEDFCNVKETLKDADVAFDIISCPYPVEVELLSSDPENHHQEIRDPKSNFSRTFNLEPKEDESIGFSELRVKISSQFAKEGLHSWISGNRKHVVSLCLSVEFPFHPKLLFPKLKSICVDNWQILENLRCPLLEELIIEKGPYTHSENFLPNHCLKIHTLKIPHSWLGKDTGLEFVSNFKHLRELSVLFAFGGDEENPDQGLQEMKISKIVKSGGSHFYPFPQESSAFADVI